jgi:hypothetical protein
MLHGMFNFRMMLKMNSDFPTKRILTGWCLQSRVAFCQVGTEYSKTSSVLGLKGLKQFIWQYRFL